MPSIKRLHYFDHQFLMEADFTDEQKYHVDMRRQHNHLLHTPGVLEGLEVTGTGGTVNVAAGSAVDARGREIVLLEPQTVPLPGAPATAAEVYVAYREFESDSRVSADVTGNTRITEEPEFAVRTIAPAAAAGAVPDGGILLAQLALNAGQLATAPNNSVRTFAGSKVADDLTVRTLGVKRDGVVSSQWPKLSCSDANQMALTGGSLRLDDQREIAFADRGQIKSFDDNHKLVFNRQGNLLELHEFGDIRLLTGGSPPTEKMRVLANGNVGIGTATPDRSLTIATATGANYLNVKDASREILMGVDAAGGIVSVMSNHDLSFRTGANTERVRISAKGNVGIGTADPQGTLDVRGAIRAGTSEVYFTEPNHAHTGIGNAAGLAAIENSSNYNTLMILGRTVSTSPLKRSVSVWDVLNVNGSLIVAQSQTIKIGVGTARYGSDGIRGEPNLWLDAADKVFIKGGTTAIGSFDIAERFETDEKVEAGQVVVFDDQKQAVRLCDREADTRVVGIASGDPAFILGSDEGQTPIALCGRVTCKVDADIAPVVVGDLLTTSATRGHAQKVLDRAKATGAVIGKALTALSHGKGEVLVLVTLQ